MDDQLRRRSVGAPAARSLLLTILGEYVLPRDEAVWQETLVRALVSVGYSSDAARQAVARSTATPRWVGFATVVSPWAVGTPTNPHSEESACYACRPPSCVCGPSASSSLFKQRGAAEGYRDAGVRPVLLLVTSSEEEGAGNAGCSTHPQPRVQ